MRDSCRKLPDRLQFLGLRQLMLQNQPPRDVLSHKDVTHATIVTERRHGHFHERLFPFPKNDLNSVEPNHLECVSCLSHGSQHLSPIPLDLKPCKRLTYRFAERDPEQPFRTGSPFPPSPLPVDADDECFDCCENAGPFSCNLFGSVFSLLHL